MIIFFRVMNRFDICAKNRSYSLTLDNLSARPGVEERTFDYIDHFMFTTSPSIVGFCNYNQSVTNLNLKFSSSLAFRASNKIARCTSSYLVVKFIDQFS
jgi:hypothetical protein